MTAKAYERCPHLFTAAKAKGRGSFGRTGPQILCPFRLKPYIPTKKGQGDVELKPYFDGVDWCTDPGDVDEEREQSWSDWMPETNALFFAVETRQHLTKFREQ